MAQVRWLYTNAFTLAGLTLLVAGPTGHASNSCCSMPPSPLPRRTRTTPSPASRTTTSATKHAQRPSAQGLDEPSRLPEWHRPHPGRSARETGGRATTTWTLCYIPNKGLKSGYGCTGTEVYKEKGVYERDVKMTSFWQNDNIVWEEGIKEMHLVMKDDSGGNGHAHKRPDPEKFFPTKMRITMIQVAKGSTYDPKLVPKLPEKK